MEINIIHRNDNFIIVEKPVGVPSQPDKTGDTDLLSELEKRFGAVWLLHRLDRPVGGLMVFALNEKTASDLNKQINNGFFKKYYLAVCCGIPVNDKAELRDWLVKNQRLNISTVTNRGNKNAKEAVLKYSVIKTTIDDKFKELSLVSISLMTGRHHQIRVQMSNANMPLWGDIKYNPSFKRGYYNVSPALYSSRLEFIDPSTKKAVIFETIPEHFPFDLFI